MLQLSSVPSDGSATVSTEHDTWRKQSEQRIVTPICLDVITLRLHLLAKHLQAVVAGFVDFARLTLGAEVTVAGRQFIYDTIETNITLARRLLVLNRTMRITVSTARHSYTTSMLCTTRAK